MRTILAIAALSFASLSATAALADDVTPDQRPLEQIEFSHNAVFGYTVPANSQEVSPEHRGLGEDGFRHSSQANYGGDASVITDVSPDKRPLGL